MKTQTAFSKKHDTMPHRPLEACHGGKGAVDWIGVLAEEDLPGRRLRFLHDDILQPGHSVGLHTHTHDEEYYYFLSGRGVMTLNNHQIDVSAGDVTAVFPGGRHALENTGDQPMRFIVISVSADVPSPHEA